MLLFTKIKVCGLCPILQAHLCALFNQICDGQDRYFLFNGIYIDFICTYSFFKKLFANKVTGDC